jgi:hypothetical protein
MNKLFKLFLFYTARDVGKTSRQRKSELEQKRRKLKPKRKLFLSKSYSADENYGIAEPLLDDYSVDTINKLKN